MRSQPWAHVELMRRGRYQIAVCDKPLGTAADVLEERAVA